VTPTRRSTTLGAFRAVFWSFLGIRRKSDYAADVEKLKPHHVIIAGLVAAAAFVLILFGIVKLVTR
jgi:Protein of unknown function (DUF2970)